MEVEICANSYESALAAQAGGADRIELCQELSLGGITPSYGLIEKVVQTLKIPTYVLIRPRSGDFTYTNSEFDVMLRDVAFAKAQGVAGIVSAVLRSDNTIDLERTKLLMAASGELPFTFCRAFDWVPDPELALETLISIGVSKILTSGQAPSALEGLELLQKLLAKAQNHITIIPGGGLSLANVLSFKKAGFKEVHGSVSKPIQGQTHALALSDHTLINSGLRHISDAATIKALVLKILNSET